MSRSKKDESLIPESLSQFFRRMAKAFRAPPPLDAVAIAKLSRVVELHHRMSAALSSAASRTEDQEGREHIEELAGREVELAEAMGRLVAELGGSPPRPEESTEALPREPKAMTEAHGRAEVIEMLGEDLTHVAAAHRELLDSPDVPRSMMDRLEELRVTEPSVLKHY